MRTLRLSVAVLALAAPAFAGLPGAAPPAEAPSPRSQGDTSPIADSPPPPLRSDLGAVVDSTVTLGMSTPAFPGRASLLVTTDSDIVRWSANAAAGAAFSQVAGNALTWPPFKTDPGTPEQVHNALQYELDPGKLEALASTLSVQNYPSSIASLKAKAASIRANPNASRANPVFPAKVVGIEFPTSEKAGTSVVVCHVVHTGGASDLLVYGAAENRLPNRTGRWVEAALGDTPGSKVAAIVVRATEGDQAWTMDRCLVTGYTKPVPRPNAPSTFQPGSLDRALANLKPTTAVPAGRASGASSSGFANPGAAQPSGAATSGADVVTVQRPVLADRAVLSAEWRAAGRWTAKSRTDAASGELTVAAEGEGRGGVSFALTVDVRRTPQQAEIVSCTFANGSTAPWVLNGEAVAPMSMRTIDVPLPRVETAAWQSARFASASLNGSLAFRGCRVSAATASGVAPRRTVY
jgi:hypothetical protein